MSRPAAEDDDRAKFKDNERYWKRRHKRLGGKLSAVGDVRRSEEENIRLYAIRRKLVFDVLRGIGLANSLAGSRVLDAGCGIGLFAEIFFILGAEVIGLDVSKIALEQAALRCPGAEFRLASLTDFEMEGPAFDLTISADVLYHIIDDDNWAAAVRNLAAHTRRGGFLVIVDHLHDEPQMPSPHVRFRTLAMYRSVLAESGAVDVTPPNQGGIHAWRFPIGD